jgi:serine/threonine protein kinase
MLQRNASQGANVISDDLDSRARARLHTTLKRKYHVEDLIGSGGMASVYSASHRNGLRVAIKVLHPHLSFNTELRTRFLREGYAANRVDHAGIVRVLDDEAMDDGTVYLVMDLLEGETLDARWKRAGQRLPLREVCTHAYALLDVLAAAHAKGVVHRDIKPENLFLTREGLLKVLDFGIARLLETDGGDAVTRTGCTIGTPPFMSPEQALGRSSEIDGQSDVWAVGATIFTLVSGQYVHEGETASEILIRAGSEPARSLRDVAPEVPEAIAEVVDRATAFDKADRWPDARSMQEALAKACAEASRSTLALPAAYGAPTAAIPSRPPGPWVATPLPPSLGVRPSSRRRRRESRRTSWSLLVLAALIGIGASLFAARRSTPVVPAPGAGSPPPPPAAAFTVAAPPPDPTTTPSSSATPPSTSASIHPTPARRPRRAPRRHAPRDPTPEPSAPDVPTVPIVPVAPVVPFEPDDSPAEPDDPSNPYNGPDPPAATPSSSVNERPAVRLGI